MEVEDVEEVEVTTSIVPRWKTHLTGFVSSDSAARRSFQSTVNLVDDSPAIDRAL